MFLTLAILFSLSFVFMAIFYCLDAFSHKQMTVKYSKYWDYGTFDDFKTEFVKVSLSDGWERNDCFKYSFFCKERDSEIHAGIVVFNDKGMVLRFFDYVKLCHFLYKNRLGKKKGS